MRRIGFSRPRRLSSVHRSAVRRSCHTIAFPSGSPVFRSQRSVVSRWFVTPIAATATPFTRALVSAPASAFSMLRQISSGSCSTQPGRGKCCGSSA
jgi:hypothetical protein